MNFYHRFHVFDFSKLHNRGKIFGRENKEGLQMLSPIQHQYIGVPSILNHQILGQQLLLKSKSESKKDALSFWVFPFISSNQEKKQLQQLWQGRQLLQKADHSQFLLYWLILNKRALLILLPQQFLLLNLIYPHLPFYFSPHHFTLIAMPAKLRIKTIIATNGFNINNKSDQCISDTVLSSIFSIDLFITSSVSPSDADLNTDAAKTRTPRIAKTVSILPTSITTLIPTYYKKYEYIKVCPTIKMTLWGVLGDHTHTYIVFPIHPSYSCCFFGLFQYGDLHSGQMMGVSSLLEIHVCPHRSQVHRHTETCSFAIDTVTGNHYKKLTLRLYLWVKYIYALSVTVLVTQMEAKISKAKLERIRKMRAFAIIAKGDMPKRIEEHREVYVVPSQSQPQKTYTVTHNGHWECTCPDHQETGLKCKHIQSVQMWQKLEQQTEDDILTLKAEIEHPQCPECESYAVVKNGKRMTEQGKKQRYVCKDCGKRFVPERNKHRKASVKLVALCMDLYFKGLSLRKISDTIEQFYDMEVSHVTDRRAGC